MKNYPQELKETLLSLIHDILAKEMYLGKVNNKRQVTDIFHYDTIK